MKYARYFIGIVLLLGCAEARQEGSWPTAAPGQAAVPFKMPAGFRAEPLPYTLNRPTQFLVADNVLWVAQLNGGENDGRGQLLRIDLASGRQTVILDGLDKPTGVALVDGILWVATRDALLRANPSTPNLVETMVSGLPNNGRSNGTLTITPTGQLLYETSGNRGEPQSGKLWELNPRTAVSRPIATGLKGGYAHTFDAAGRLWITEIADGSVAGVALPDELNLVVEGADFGWPSCYGRELAGPDCTGVRAAVVTFPVSSTPTSIVPSPFDPNTLLVALWVRGEVVAVPITLAGDNAVGEVRPFLSGLGNPQHLVVLEDGSLLVSDFAAGKIYRVFRQ